MTWRGWLVLGAVVIAVFVTVFFGVHPFLAETERTGNDVLVIEGWMPDYALLDGWDEFQRGHYAVCVTVGGPFRGGVKLDPEDNYGDLGAYKIRQMVGRNAPVQPVPCPKERRDRTFTCAITLQKWLAAHYPQAKSITIVTLGPHARRSRLLYQKVFHDKPSVGVVAVQSEDYEADRWWRYSEGVKEVMSEGAAYLYVRLFFHPSE